MNKIQGKILHGSEWINGEVHFDKKISNIVTNKNNSEDHILPGFIDLHVHGGGGHDTMEAGDALIKICETHAKNGTTSLLATTMTAPNADIENALMAVEKIKKGNYNGSRIIGVHLEGPFISSEKLGAQPDFTDNDLLSNPSHVDTLLNKIKYFHDLSNIKVITLAPEYQNNLQLISALKNLKIVVQIGHTNCSYEQAHQALKAGARSFTHLFNAMSSFHHRVPGAVGAALTHAEFSELIPDLLHVHPGAIKIALKCIPKLYFVTDATAATGMPDGEYILGKQTVYKCLGGVKLKDGTLAGSALTTLQAFKNLISIGLDPIEISHRMSQIPAELIGENERGVISKNYYADLLVFDKNWNLKSVYIEGQCI